MLASAPSPWLYSRRAEVVLFGGPALASVFLLVLGARHVTLFLAPLIAFAFLEEWGWDRFVWHDNGTLFPGTALDPGPILLSLLVPLLALPQATHDLLDPWIWRGFEPDSAG